LLKKKIEEMPKNIPPPVVIKEKSEKSEKADEE